MWMLRRCGPLLNGVLLDRMTGNKSYRPTWHVTCLGSGDDFLPLTLATRLSLNHHGVAEAIRMLFHTPEKVATAATRLREQALLPLEGPLSKRQVLAAYQAFMSQKFWHNMVSPHHLFSDIVRLHAWCGDSDQAECAARTSASRLGTEFGDNYSKQQVDKWLHEQLDRAARPALVHDLVEKEIDGLDLRRLPTGDFVCDR